MLPDNDTRLACYAHKKNCQVGIIVSLQAWSLCHTCCQEKIGRIRNMHDSGGRHRFMVPLVEETGELYVKLGNGTEAGRV